MRVTGAVGAADGHDVQRSPPTLLARIPERRSRERRRAHGARAVWDGDDGDLHGTSLDHTIWFHRPVHADRWHVHDVTCHHLVGSRGLAMGHVFDEHGTHVATYSQEVLMRLPRD